ncbi:MAG: hypothetical protein N2663_01695 [Chlorobi bacterium]|nr:hypothetical protein [Chlorobiota bacterium]
MIGRIFVSVYHRRNMTLHTFLCCALFATGTVYLHAQRVTVVLPDTVLHRGETAALTIVISTPVATGDTIGLRMEYPRAALRIETILAKFPAEIHIFNIEDELRFGETGWLTARMVCAQATSRIELVAVCSALWSGTSPAHILPTAVWQNGQPLTVQASGGSLVFKPAATAEVKPLTAVGPIAPHPVEGDRFRVTLWLADSSTPVVVLYDPVGRELAQWSLGLLPAGTHSVELSFNRTATSAGLYYLCLRRGEYVSIVPCMIGK